MKVAIVGTSNIGALKYAAPRIAQTFPDIEVTFFGLPGGKFDKTRVDGTIFGPDRSDLQLYRLSRRVNGAPQIDLAPFDHILVIGDTFGLPACLFTAIHYDIADWPARNGKPLMSEPAFLSAMDEAIALRTDHLRAQFGALRLHAALAPYPTTGVVPEGPHHQQPYAAMATHPDAARIEEMFHNRLRAALHARDISFVPQPPETVAQPFLTKEPFGIGSQDFRTEGVVLNDHRHMNADFGTSLFTAFAIAIGQAPQI
ncbi:hypothetical protein [Hasllibacter sp. MH4015]|uniref:hypothetical protein n=1 Tax=Hasllibacter sp. MH4015 TaxID=2854029 RepID=UPI001CD72EA9|nr:hypothetical protein [Hasllibacter sp. MH4015]